MTKDPHPPRVVINEGALKKNVNPPPSGSRPPPPRSQRAPATPQPPHGGAVPPPTHGRQS
jgi:hypothetical protein